MPNQPIYTVTVASETLVTTVDVIVKTLRWIGATTAGHKCIVKDPNDVIIWESEAAGSSYVEMDGITRYWPGGFKVTTLGSGTFYVETDYSLYQGLRNNRG